MTGGTLHQRNRAGNLIRAATQARPVTFFFRFFSRAKKSDVAPQRPARWARRTAINMRRAHGKHEAPIGPGVACQRGLTVPRGRVRRNVLYESGLCLAHVRYAKSRSEEHTSELQSLAYLVCRLLLEK